uniref:Heat shock factor-binding protein 1 n=1 Tax=Macrostomum lignano TaxID=282301 RepID=A0A1I8JRI1_9PLAT
MAASATVPGTERVFREMNREMDRMDRMMKQMLLNGERAPAGSTCPDSRTRPTSSTLTSRRTSSSSFEQLTRTQYWTHVSN